MNATVINFPSPDKEKPRKLYLLGKPTASITDLAAYRKAAMDMCRAEHPAMTLAQIAGTAIGTMAGLIFLALQAGKEASRRSNMQDNLSALRRVQLQAMLNAGMFRYQPQP